GAFALGDVLQHVDDTHLPSARIHKWRVGGKKVAGKPRIRRVSFASHAFAIRANRVIRLLARKQIRQVASNGRLELAAAKLGHPLVEPQNAAFAIVDYDRIAYGVKGER